jgi:hypothetical protein
LYVPDRKRGTASGKYAHSPYEHRTVVCSRLPVPACQIGRVFQFPEKSQIQNTHVIRADIFYINMDRKKTQIIERKKDIIGQKLLENLIHILPYAN